MAAESGLTDSPGHIFLNQDAAGGTLTLGTVDDLITGSPATISGVVAGGTVGQISITTEADNLTVDDDVTANGTGTIDLTAGGTDSLIDQNAHIGASDGAVTLTADNMALEGGTIDSGAETTTLTVFTTDATISLGDNTASDADANLELSDAELETITTTGGIVVGATNAGDITVQNEDPIDLDDVNLTLITGGSIGDNGNAAATITLRDTGGASDAILTLDSDTGVGGSQGVGGNALGIDVVGLAAAIAGRRCRHRRQHPRP